MPREHPDYRATIEQLNRRFADKEMLTTADVMQITGYRSANSVRNNYPMQRGRIAKTTLARLMCGKA